jgi:uncharacterized protein with NRDE domain
VCLLIAAFGTEPDAPLIIAANRDERLDRPAVAMTVLRERGPRILGGRDLLAGGTWLAVNEHGVVAGLTNQPSAGGRDPGKKTRGELPLAFAEHASAAEGVAAVCAELDPAQYNPCWLLVGDRSALFFVGIGSGRQPDVGELGPGLHVLENAPLSARSAKAEFVRRLAAEELAARPGQGAAGRLAAMEAVLRSHRPAVPEPRTDETGRVWPPEISAPCVHTAAYGTRSAMTVVVPAAGLPVVRVADGQPCTHPFLDATGLWSEGHDRSE